MLENGAQAVFFKTEHFTDVVFKARQLLGMDIDISTYRTRLREVESIVEQVSQENLNQQELLESYGVITAELEAQNLQLLESEQQIQESQKRFSKLFDVAPTGFVLIKRFAGQILEMNPKARQMMGGEQTPVPFLLSSVFDQTRVPSEKAQRRKFDNWLHYSEGESVDLKIQDEPEARWVQLEQTTFDNDTLLIAMTDITHLRNTYQALEQERSLNQSKAVFLTNMTHEMRTPMHAILSFSKLAQKQIENPENLPGYLNNISLSAIRLNELLTNLLDLSRYESGEVKTQFVKQDITKLIISVADSLSGLLATKNIKLNIDAGRQFDCMIDQKQITRLFVNLFSNSVKFSPENASIDILVEPGVSGLDRDALKIVFIDEGPGVPMDELQRIFAPFEESSQTRTGAGGTGLGLSICREIVLLHDGDIRAESPPKGRSKGTAFYISLPLKQNTSEAP